MKKAQLEDVRHDLIRYANCWEDADVLIRGLKLQKGDKILSIASAGDNSFSLLTGDPELVLAVDINAVQLRLTELKKEAIRQLNHDQFLEFIGFRNSDRRLEIYQHFSENIPDELRLYWDQRLDEIQAGLIHQGKFEKYFGLFRNKILPFIHSSKRVDQLFEVKSEKEQKSFHQKKWNNRRWNLLFKLFFSKTVMGKFGRDPAFLKEVKFNVSDFILGQSKRHLSSVECQKNYFLYYIMKGHFGTELPHYARKENYPKIRKNIDRLEVFHGLAEDAFKVHRGFNKFNLSNIFEYMNPELFKSVTQNLVDNGEKGSVYGYWNLMVPRQMSRVNDELEKEEVVSDQLSLADKGFFYSNVNFDVKV